jgi:DNA polymerase (family 10)
MDRSHLSTLLKDIALYMELLGENPFKVRAHQNGARVIEQTEDLENRVKNNNLNGIKGIGPALQEKIKEFYKTGELAEHEELKLKIPAGILILLQVPGLGPKKAKLVHDKFDIKSLGELEYACRENRLAKISGFGEKTQEKILKSLEFLKKNQNIFLYSDAILEAQLLTGFIKSFDAVASVEIVGGLRRKLEIVKGVGILIASEKQTSEILGALADYPGITKFKIEGAEASFVLSSGIQCKVKVASLGFFAQELLKLTGSSEHLKELKAYAFEAHKINLDSWLRQESFQDEAQIYKKLGLDYIEPELREGRSEIGQALKHELPKLIDCEELRGFFHCHTSESDGANTLEEMVNRAQVLGYEYIGISDHSVSSLAYANGLKKERVLDQFEMILALQKKFKIKILKGIESDILTDGSLDYEDSFLKKFDFVIGSIHSGFAQKREQMTARVLKALSNPYLDFLGHPTGRLLLAREGYEIDMESVIAKASELGVVIEINASPQRLDMDWRLGTYLKSKKGLVSINPDAHSVAGIDDIEFGVGIARKAGLSSLEVINTLPADKILSRLRRAHA